MNPSAHVVFCILFFRTQVSISKSDASAASEVVDVGLDPHIFPLSVQHNAL